MIAALAAIPAIVDAVGNIIGDLNPDSRAKLEAKLDSELKRRGLDLEAAKLADRGLERQVEVNKIEAASASPMARTWRPALGWVCAVGIAYHFLGHPLITWGFVIARGEPSPPPSIEVGPLIALVVSLLGVGGYRSLEKILGVRSQ